jgi:hypothetical protein
MKTTALLLAAALLPAARAFAQSPTLPDLQELVGAYPTATAAPSIAGGSVTYFGVVNSHDAQHEQFARLRQAFAQTKPTMVFFEKPDLGVDSTEAATISRLGESGYVRFLAQQYQVPTARLDDPVAEYAYLSTQLAPQPLQLYWLLRTTQQYRQHTSASKVLLMRQVQALIASGATCMPGSPLAIQRPAQLQAAYRQHCPTGGQWWKLPATSFADQPVAGQRTEPFLAAINHTVSTYRAQRLAAQVATAVQAGQRVLVVVDRDHLPVAAPATYAARLTAGK